MGSMQQPDPSVSIHFFRGARSAVPPIAGFGRFFNIVEANDLYIERLNQLDFRLSKIFRFATTRTAVNFDFYNVTNSNSVIAENATYGGAWRNVQGILLPRLFKISAQLDF